MDYFARREAQLSHELAEVIASAAERSREHSGDLAQLASFKAHLFSGALPATRAAIVDAAKRQKTTSAVILASLCAFIGAIAVVVATNWIWQVRVGVWMAAWLAPMVAYYIGRSVSELDAALGELETTTQLCLGVRVVTATSADDPDANRVAVFAAAIDEIPTTVDQQLARMPSVTVFAEVRSPSGDRHSDDGCPVDHRRRDGEP